MIDVLTVGILVADIIARPVNKIPKRGKLENTSEISIHAGGCAFNTGLVLSKLGLKVGVAGRLGRDYMGNFLLERLSQGNVNTQSITFDNEALTSASLVMVDPRGERSFIHNMGANANFLEKHIDYDLVEEAKLIFVGGSMLMPSFDGEETRAFLKKCKDMDKITALDTAWDSTGQWMKNLRPALPYIDYFMPSYEEACKFSNEEDLDKIADYFLNKGPHTIVIKLGEKGSFAKNVEGERYLVPAFENINLIDSTGAGDSFCAGFLMSIIRGWDLQKSLEFANAVGAHCCMKLGATSMETNELEIIKFIEKHRGDKF